MASWYVMQVFTGREEHTGQVCRERIDREIISQVFVPGYEYMKKYQGSWHRESDPLFPGYVFLEAEDIEKVREELVKLPNFTKVLDTGGDFLPLSDEDEEILRRLLDKDYILQMSEGYIEGDKIKVSEGPLKGHEGWIKKIDRHKRKARLEMDIFGKKIRTEAGLEIIRKE